MSDQPAGAECDDREAARAGEAGKGFEVVAGEVKALATQTANATREISGQIEAVRAATDGSIASIRGGCHHHRPAGRGAAVIAAAVEEQSATTRKIAANLQTVTAGAGLTVVAMNPAVDRADDAGTVSQQVLGAAAALARRQSGFAPRSISSSARCATTRATAGCTSRIPAMAPRRYCPHAAVVVQDLSRGGTAMACDWELQAGVELSVELPGAGGAVTGRVVRSDGRVVAVVFRQDAEALARLDRALAAFGGERRAA